MIKYLNGQASAVPRGSVADIVPALGFQADPDAPGGVVRHKIETDQSDSQCAPRLQGEPLHSFPSELLFILQDPVHYLIILLSYVMDICSQYHFFSIFFSYEKTLLFHNKRRNSFISTYTPFLGL